MVTVRFYEHKDKSNWERLVAHSNNGTFLQTRLFLSYHKNRFKDRSIVIEENNSIVGVLPAAESLDDGKIVVSHPGITYGGLVCGEKLRGKKCVDALDNILVLLKISGYSKLLYKAVPYFYFRRPAQDDIYALFRVGATLVCRNLSVAVDLRNRADVAERRKRGIQRGSKNRLRILTGLKHAPVLWELLCDNLRRKHETKPVHSLEEISHLAEMFNEQIEFITVAYEEKIIGGVVLFKTNNVWHTQYIASSKEGNHLNALDFLFEYLIQKAISLNILFFDFGICCEQEGKILNQGLYKFKSEFGGSGVVHDFYEVILT